jgi:hypothetical protein
MYAVCNWGTPRGVFFTRREALLHARITAARDNIKDWRTVYEINKVRVAPFVNGGAR